MYSMYFFFSEIKWILTFDIHFVRHRLYLTLILTQQFWICLISLTCFHVNSFDLFEITVLHFILQTKHTVQFKQSTSYKQLGKYPFSFVVIIDTWLVNNNSIFLREEQPWKYLFEDIVINNMVIGGRRIKVQLEQTHHKSTQNNKIPYGRQVLVYLRLSTIIQTLTAILSSTIAFFGERRKLLK